MNIHELPLQISQKDFDLERFVRLSLSEETVREAIINLMLHNPDIMVYYHAFYVLEKASLEQPRLFYACWPEFAGLLRHSNSYHRDFGLVLLANLAVVDREDRFSKVLPEYLEHIHDAKFMTAECCIRSLAKIIRHKPHLKIPILATLLVLDQTSPFSERQKALLKCEVLHILEEIFPTEPDQTRLADFIRAQLDSPSPKTRKKATALVKKYQI